MIAGAFWGAFGSRSVKGDPIPQVPIIDQQPVDEIDLLPGEDLTRAIIATSPGGSALFYQWLVLFPGALEWMEVQDDFTTEGSNSATLAIENVSALYRNAQYRCDVSNAFGSTSTRAAATFVIIKDSILFTYRDDFLDVDEDGFCEDWGQGIEGDSNQNVLLTSLIDEIPFPSDIIHDGITGPYGSYDILVAGEDDEVEPPAYASLMPIEVDKLYKTSGPANIHIVAGLSWIDPDTETIVVSSVEDTAGGYSLTAIGDRFTLRRGAEGSGGLVVTGSVGPIIGQEDYHVFSIQINRRRTAFYLDGVQLALELVGVLDTNTIEYPLIFANASREHGSASGSAIVEVTAYDDNEVTVLEAIGPIMKKYGLETYSNWKLLGGAQSSEDLGFFPPFQHTFYGINHDVFSEPIDLEDGSYGWFFQSQEELAGRSSLRYALNNNESVFSVGEVWRFEMDVQNFLEVGGQRVLSASFSGALQQVGQREDHLPDDGSDITISVEFERISEETISPLDSILWGCGVWDVDVLTALFTRPRFSLVSYIDDNGNRIEVQTKPIPANE